MLFRAAHKGAFGSVSGDRDSSRCSEYSPHTSVNGLCTLVQTAAAELRDNGVTVNALLPTTIDTPQVRSWYGDAEATNGSPAFFGFAVVVAGLRTGSRCHRRNHSGRRATESAMLSMARRDRVKTES